MSDSARDEIIALEHDLIAATSGEEFMSFVDEKEIVLYSFLMPLQCKGANAVRERTSRELNLRDLYVEFLDHDIVVDTTLAVARSIQRMCWTDKDGNHKEGNWRVTCVWQKVDGKWKLNHLHSSVPLDPATGMGQMNLTE